MIITLGLGLNSALITRGLGWYEEVLRLIVGFIGALTGLSGMSGHIQIRTE